MSKDPASRPFWSELAANFILNLVATLIGVYFGLTLTLNADREKQVTLEKKQAVEKVSEDSTYIFKTFTLIRKELLETQADLKIREEEIKQNQNRYLNPHPMSNALWKAIVSSGGLERIKDLDLLDAISRAYRHVEYIMFLEETQIQRATPAGSTTWNNNAMGNIRAADKEVGEVPIAKKAVMNALYHIDKSLSLKHLEK